MEKKTKTVVNLPIKQLTTDDFNYDYNIDYPRLEIINELITIVDFWD